MRVALLAGVAALLVIGQIDPVEAQTTRDQATRAQATRAQATRAQVSPSRPNTSTLQPIFGFLRSEPVVASPRNSSAPNRKAKKSANGPNGPNGKSKKKEGPARHFGEGTSNGPLQLVVSLRDQHAVLYSNGVRISDARVSTGTPGHPTPSGVFSVIQKDRWHRSNIYGAAPMFYMHRLTWSGIALHEGHLPGFAASHGCIRMPTDFVSRLWNVSRLGLRVVVARTEVTPREFSHAKLFNPAPKPDDNARVSERTDDLRRTLAAADFDPMAGQGYVRLAQAEESVSDAPNPAGAGESLVITPAPAAPASALLAVEAGVSPSIAVESARSGSVAADAVAGAETVTGSVTLQPLPAVESNTPADTSADAVAEPVTTTVAAPVPEPAAEPATTDAAATSVMTPASEPATTSTVTAPAPQQEPESGRTAEIPAEPAATPAAATATPAVPAATPAAAAPEPNLPAIDPNELRMPRPAPLRSRTAEPVKLNGQVAVFISRKDKRIYVRNAFVPLFDMPVEIADPNKPFGTHTYTALGLTDGGTQMRWNVISVGASGPPRGRAAKQEQQRNARGKAAVAQVASGPAVSDPAEALDRVTIPAAAVIRISELLTPGSSLIISDEGLGRETGRYTEFIVETRQ